MNELLLSGGHHKQRTLCHACHACHACHDKPCMRTLPVGTTAKERSTSLTMHLRLIVT